MGGVSPEPLGRIPKEMSVEEGVRLGLESAQAILRKGRNRSLPIRGEIRQGWQQTCTLCQGPLVTAGSDCAGAKTVRAFGVRKQSPDAALASLHDTDLPGATIYASFREFTESEWMRLAERCNKHIYGFSSRCTVLPIVRPKLTARIVGY